MEHTPAGVDWEAGGAVPLCSCGWIFEPVPIGPGWIEELERQWDAHLEAA